jgi:hypothetical protein
VQAELARLKREAAARRAAQQMAQQAAQPAAAEPGATAAAGSAMGDAAAAVDAPPVITEDLLRTLKVSWSAKVSSTYWQKM